MSVYDALEIVSKEDWEASLPPPAFEIEIKSEELPKTPKTPASSKVKQNFKKGKKTPKASNKPDPIAEAKKKGLIANTDEGEVDKKPLKLPEAHYVEIDDYDIPDAPPMPTSYYR